MPRRSRVPFAFFPGSFRKNNWNVTFFPRLLHAVSVALPQIAPSNRGPEVRVGAVPVEILFRLARDEFVVKRLNTVLRMIVGKLR